MKEIENTIKQKTIKGKTPEIQKKTQLTVTSVIIQQLQDRA